MQADRRRRPRPGTGKSTVATKWGQTAITFAGQASLLALILVAPWAFGGVQPAFWNLCFPLLGFGLACWVLLLGIRRRREGRLPTGSRLLLIGFAWALLGLAAMPQSLLSWLSPQAASWRAEFCPLPPPPLGVPIDAARPVAATAESPAARPSTLCPADTRRDLSLLSMGLVAYWLSARFFRRNAPQKWLLILVAANGVALALFGIVQQLSWNGKLYWAYELTYGGTPFAAYRNRNHAAGYLLMCLAAGLGVVHWLLSRGAYRPASFGGPEDVARLTSRTLNARAAWAQFLQFVGNQNALSLAALLGLSTIAGGIVFSLSRGAILALTGSVVGTTLAVRLAARQPVRWWMIGFTVVSVLLATTWLGMSRLVSERMQTVLDPAQLFQDERWLNWGEALAATPGFWLMGSGLGTYGYAHMPFQRRHIESWHVRAENQYVETLLELGVPGLVVLLAIVATMFAATIRLLRRGSDPAGFRLGLMGACLLCGQALHALSDFGLYMPANLLLLATLCGAFAGRDAQQRQRRNKPAKKSAARSLRNAIAWQVPLLMAGLSMATFFGWRETRRLVAIRSIIEQSDEIIRLEYPPIDVPSRYTQPEVEQAIDALAGAVRDRWDDPEAHLQLARLYTRLFRFHVYANLPGQGDNDNERQIIWWTTAPMHMYAYAVENTWKRRDNLVQSLRVDPVVVQYLHPVRSHLEWARETCPYIAETHCRLAELEFLYGDPRDNLADIARADRLAPGNANIQFLLGVLHHFGRRPEQAYAAWRTTWTAMPSRAHDVMRLLYPRGVASPEVRSPSVQELLDHVVPQQPEILADLAVRFFAEPSLSAERKQVVARAEKLLDAATYPPGMGDYYRALVARAGGDLARADELFAKALDAAPNQLQWRFEWATTLRELGRLDKAMAQARVCVAAAPGRGDFQGLYQQLVETIDTSRSSGQRTEPGKESSEPPRP